MNVTFFTAKISMGIFLKVKYKNSAAGELMEFIIKKINATKLMELNLKD